jgi:hypothetical protein
MFLAELSMWRPLLAFCRRPFGENRRVIDEFIRRHQGQIDAAAASRTRIIQLETEGEHHDLAAIFDRVNAKYFKRRCDARVTWGRALNGKKRHGIQLGSWDPATNVIRIHRALDRPWAPRYVLENLMYHEMLHWLFRPRKAGSRRVVHGRAFRDAEQAHPNYLRTQQWVKDNLDRLLRG